MPKKRENPERVIARAIGFDNEGCLLVQREIDGKCMMLFEFLFF